MTRESWIAGALTLFCAVAAVGSWFTHQPAKKSEAADTAVGSALLSGSADIARLDVQGEIVDGGDGVFGNGASAADLLTAIKKVRQDGVKVVLLNLNSPGGTAAGSQAVYEDLMRLKRDKGVKIVATMGDMAASGAYYIACAADEIVANPATLTGSIGVIMHTANYQGLMGKIGVTEGAIKSGAHKDIGSPYRAMTPDERAMIQALINNTYEQFLGAVAEGRHLPVAQVRPIADGRIFTGQEALKVKLVDKLGNYTDAVAEAKRIGKLGDSAKIKDYTQPGWRDMLGQLADDSKVSPIGHLLGLGAAQLPLERVSKVPLMLYE